MKTGRIILSGPGHPCFNMALDEAIFASPSAPPTLRMYEWSPPGITIGFFQKEENFQNLGMKDIVIVRRITGGGAIYHRNELTMSCRLPLPFPGIPRPILECYEKLHQPLLEVLKGLGIPAHLRGRRKEARSKGEPPFCFDREAPFDIVWEGMKIAGSAQRRKKGVLFQQTSILLKKNSYAGKGVGLEDILKRPIGASTLIPLLHKAYESLLGLPLIRASESPEEKKKALALQKEKQDLLGPAV